MSNEGISEPPAGEVSRQLKELHDGVRDNMRVFMQIRPLIEQEAERRYPKSDAAKAAQEKLVRMIPFAPMPPDVLGMSRDDMRQTMTEFLKNAQQFMREAGYYSQPPPSELERQSKAVLEQFVGLLARIEELDENLKGQSIDPNWQG